MERYAERLQDGFDTINEGEEGSRDYAREDSDPRGGTPGWRARRRYHDFWESIEDDRIRR